MTIDEFNSWLEESAKQGQWIEKGVHEDEWKTIKEKLYEIDDLPKIALDKIISICEKKFTIH